MRLVKFWKIATVSILWSLLSNALASEIEDNSDNELLLKIAREYRFGNGEMGGKKSINLERAVHFYQYVIERTLHSEGSGEYQDYNTTNPVLGTTAALELYQLLEEKDIASKYTKWELLQVAADGGVGEAQHVLSVALGTGLFHNTLVPLDPARALLLEQSAALSGHVLANLGMGYRHLVGLGVGESCERALGHYEVAANIAAKDMEMHIHTGFGLAHNLGDRVRLSETLDPSTKYMGSVSRGGGGNAEATAELRDYYTNLADGGDVSAAHVLGSLYYAGTRHLPPDVDMALHYLGVAGRARHVQACGLLAYLVARMHHHHLVHIHDNVDLATFLTTSKPNLDLSAEEVFDCHRLSFRKGDANGIVAQGYLTQHGLWGEAKNVSKALDFFHRALHVHADAGYWAGELLMSRGGRDANQAAAVYGSSAALGHPLSMHRLGLLTAQGPVAQQVFVLHPGGKGVQAMGGGGCGVAVNYLKQVAERGLPAIVNAFHSLKARSSPVDCDKWLHTYAQLAAVGLEVAQFNAAFLLHREHCVPVPTPLPHSNANSQNSVLNVSAAARSVSAVVTNTSIAEDAQQRALALFGLSAAQGLSDSMLYIGDCHYYGYAKLNASQRQAASYYQRAADLHNTQALFNLGLLHQTGDGVDMDFHLAKRYYDLGAESDARARAARDLFLLLLQTHKSLLGLLGPEAFQSLHRGMVSYLQGFLRKTPLLPAYSLTSPSTPMLPSIPLSLYYTVSRLVQSITTYLYSAEMLEVDVGSRTLIVQVSELALLLGLGIALGILLLFRRLLR